jgi:hypothetical protein
MNRYAYQPQPAQRKSLWDEPVEDRSFDAHLVEWRERVVEHGGK